MKPWILSSAVLLGAALFQPAVAADAPPGAESGLYTIDPYHTQEVFEWRHFGISTVRGRFEKTSGTLELDVARHTAVVNVTIQANSISTGVPRLDERLKSSDFFDVKKFPTLTFRSKAFNFTGDALTSVDGELTIHGVTRPVTLVAHSAQCVTHRNPTMSLPACGADLELTLNRSDFGVGYFAPLVSDAIAIHIGVEAIKGAEGIEGQFRAFGGGARR